MSDDLIERLRNAPFCVLLNIEAADRIEQLEAEVERLREALANPPKHKFWGAGEPDCPRDIKAGNGELHTLRCKVCGEDSPRDQICRGGL